MEVDINTEAMHEKLLKQIELEAEPALAYMRPWPHIKTKAPSTDMVYNEEFCQAAPGKDDHIHSAPLHHLPPVAQPFSFLDYLPKDYYDNSHHHYDPLGLSLCEEDSQIKTIVNNMHLLDNVIGDPKAVQLAQEEPIIPVAHEDITPKFKALKVPYTKEPTEVMDKSTNGKN
uniref:Uncharacterized protein n=1 Tax=Romanomermis culicivorax TaxID=13658 RepID=A0A915IQB6_ROMCU